MILFEQTTEKSFVFLGLPALFVCSSEAATKAVLLEQAADGR